MTAKAKALLVVTMTTVLFLLTQAAIYADSIPCASGC